MPSPEDRVDPAIVTSQSEDSLAGDGDQGGGGGDTEDAAPPSSPANTQGNSEPFENPFMKPAKRIKVKPS